MEEGMSKMVGISDEAHAEAKRAAGVMGRSLSAYVSESVLNMDFYDTPEFQRLRDAAVARDCSTLETLSAALDALASPRGIQPPKPAPDRGCGCDGPEGDGPWHKPSCGRRT